MKPDTRPSPEYVEGPEAFRRFDEGMKQILSVPHATLVRRERAYRKKSLQNPHRRGPKPKRKATQPSASVRVVPAGG